MPYIYYLPDDRLVEIKEAETILETSLCAGIPHTHVCGGSARCSTCRVWVLDGLDLCAPRNDAEQALARRLHFDPKIRLACQTQVFGEGRITLKRLAIDVEDVEIIDRQLHNKVATGAIGEEKQIAILFADLRGFTSFSEALPAYDVIYVLNRYYNRMGKVIDRYGGIINNYMGDGLMALFGWDNPDRAAERAVRAAVEMQQAMTSFNTYLDVLYHRTLKIGIGIHYGQVVVGAVGASSQNMHMTAIGDAVNFASRIESANKALDSSLLISEETYNQVRDIATINRRCRVEIPGKSGEYSLYEVVDVTQASLDELQISPQIRPEPTLWNWLSRQWHRLIRGIQRLVRSLMQ